MMALNLEDTALYSGGLFHWLHSG